VEAHRKEGITKTDAWWPPLDSAPPVWDGWQWTGLRPEHQPQGIQNPLRFRRAKQFGPFCQTPEAESEKRV